MKTHVKKIKSHIKKTAGRHVQLLAVSKTHPPNSLRDMFQAGQQCFGENYLQEALTKIEALSDLDISWHFIGSIQSNKTKEIATHFDWVQTIDRLKIAERLSKQRPLTLANLNVCIQVNVDNDANKSGIAATDLISFAQYINQLKKLTLRGIMIMPANIKQAEKQRTTFAQARRLFDKLKSLYPTVDTLSMGMSNDMDIAIAEGSTMIRLGTALFGKRNYSELDKSSRLRFYN